MGSLNGRMTPMSAEAFADALILQEKIEAQLPKGDGFQTRINEQLECVIISLELHNQKAVSVHMNHDPREIDHIVKQILAEMASAVGMRLVHALGIEEVKKEKE
jgi:sorbitol-specific phosphotransferase system component IIBC